jgi:hypothetical protein
MFLILGVVSTQSASGRFCPSPQASICHKRTFTAHPVAQSKPPVPPITREAASNKTVAYFAPLGPTGFLPAFKTLSFVKRISDA